MDDFDPTRGDDDGAPFPADLPADAPLVDPIPMHVLAEQARAAGPRKRKPRPVATAAPPAPPANPADPPAAAPDPVDPDGRPVVRISTELMRVTDEAAAALCLDADVYQRAGQLVRVVRVAQDEAEAGRLEGTPELRSMSTATLRERLSAVARWVRYDARAKVDAPTLPPGAVVEALAGRGAWRGMRPLVAIAEAPFMRPDGAIVQEPGYDGGSRVLFAPNGPVERVPLAPTQADAARALESLREIFVDFPFSTPAGELVPIAAICTLLARPAIVGSVPAFLVDASTRGSGKSLITDVIATITSGRGAPRMSWPPDDEELEKVLAAYALRAAVIVAFDNIDRPFCGAPLDKVLTATDTVDLRILGRSEVPTLPWRAVVLGTGNNVTIAGDTERRVLVARLEPAAENPEDREGFRHPNLLEWVRRHRARFVAAALTILRAYVSAGRPNVGLKPWGSFEAWSALVPAALVYAGGVDVMAARPTATGEGDPEKACLMAILEGWPRLDATGRGLTLRSALASLYPPTQRGEVLPPDGFDALRTALEELAPMRGKAGVDVVRLGNAIRKMRGRWCGGRRLESVKDRTGTQMWTVKGVASGNVQTSLGL